MNRRPPISTLTHTRWPYTTLFGSAGPGCRAPPRARDEAPPGRGSRVRGGDRHRRDACALPRAGRRLPLAVDDVEPAGDDDSRAREGPEIGQVVEDEIAEQQRPYDLRVVERGEHRCRPAPICFEDEPLGGAADEPDRQQPQPLGPDRRAPEKRQEKTAAQGADEAGIEQRNRRGVESGDAPRRSEEHTSELQSLMRISYAVFCLKKKNKQQTHAHP